MRLETSIFALAALGLTAASLAGEAHKTKMNIAVVDDDGDGATRIVLDSDEIGFNLHDMQEGESRTITDSSGKNVLVTRTADGFSFEVDGKTIDVPAIGEGYHGAMFISAEHEEDVDVHVVRSGDWVPADGPAGTMIITGKPVDEATQEQIRLLLQSAGHDGDVSFIDHEGPQTGAHKMKIIRKQTRVE